MPDILWLGERAVKHSRGYIYFFAANIFKDMDTGILRFLNFKF